MNNIAINFINLLEILHSNPKIIIEKDNLRKSIGLKTERSYERGFNSAKELGNIVLNDSDSQFMEVSTIEFLWTNAAEDLKNGMFIYGGIQMKGFVENLYGDSFFWDSVIYDNPPSNETKIELKKLGAFHKSSWGDDGTYGCFYREGDYPFPIYFFDNGNFYPMNMDLSQYYEAMIFNKAVVGWQYFYIPPELIIQQLNNRKCAKWGIGFLQEVEGTRVNGLIELMNRLIDQFPHLFPDFNIKFYSEKRDTLVSAYNLFQKQH